MLSVALSLRCRGKRTRSVRPCYECLGTALNSLTVPRGLTLVSTHPSTHHCDHLTCRYIAEAEFMFEAEVKWMQLLAQRRRQVCLHDGALEASTV